jgi:hypothetical protein
LSQERQSFLPEKLKDYGLEYEMYDYRIVQASRDVYRQLGFDSRVSQVVWFDWERFGRMSSDECSFVQDGVILPKRLRGVLEADEWRPIMASRLIYRKRWMRSQPWRQTLAMLVSIPLVIFGGALMAFLFGPSRFAIPWLVYVVVVVGPIFLNLVTQAQKSMRLHADAETAVLLGKESFLSVLQKIDLLRLDDVEKTKKSRIMRHFSKKPSITERIETISRIDACPTTCQVRTT